MDLSDARQKLSTAERHELRDHAFGDAEITWVKDGQTIADGYFGGSGASISVLDDAVWESWVDFDGDDARALRECGTLEVYRNDETGPDEYQEGKVMPGLTKEGVYKELTGQDWIEEEHGVILPPKPHGS